MLLYYRKKNVNGERVEHRGLLSFAVGRLVRCWRHTEVTACAHGGCAFWAVPASFARLLVHTSYGNCMLYNVLYCWN